MSLRAKRGNLPEGIPYKNNPRFIRGFLCVFLCGFCKSMLELGVIKVVIKPVFFDKFVVSAFFVAVALVHHKSKVGGFDCRKSVRHEKRSFAFHQHLESLLDFQFGTGVD